MAIDRQVGLEFLETDEAVLGAGIRGEVRLARYHGSAALVAVKVLSTVPESVLESDEANEAEVQHPHLVRVLERRMSINGKHRLEVRELCGGGELFDHIAEEGGLAHSTPEVALEWFQQLCSAVKHCHAMGAVNGRLRSEQVLLDGQAKVRLLGFARRSPAADQPRPLSRSFSLLDAPELHGRATASNVELANADVWALGILLSALMVGMPPFAAASAEWCAQFVTFTAACAKAASGGGESGSSVTSLFGSALGTAAPELAAAVPPALLELMAAMLCPEPSRRPSAESVGLLVSAVERAGWGSADSLATVAAAAGAAAAAAVEAVGSSSSSSSSSSSAAASSKRARSPAQGRLAAAATPTTTMVVAMDTEGEGDAEEFAAEPSLSPSSSESSAASPRQTQPQTQTRPQPEQTVHVTTPRPSPRQGHVRCLGWENLAMSFAQLSEAATATLDALGVPYTVEARVQRAKPDGSSSGDCPRCDGGPSGHSDAAASDAGKEGGEGAAGLASAFIVMPPPCDLRDAALAPMQRQPGLATVSEPAPSLPAASSLAEPPLPSASASSTSTSSLSSCSCSASLLSWGGPLAAVSRPLVVSLQICAAEADDGDDELHHVDVRRRQGEHWYFQDFYARFRSEFSRRLGMQDYAQLSQFSPMQPRRRPVNHRPAAGWTAVGAATPPPPATAATTTIAAAPVRTSPLAAPRLSEPGLASGAPAAGGSGRMGSFKRVGKPGSCAGLLPSPTSPKLGRRPLP